MNNTNIHTNLTFVNSYFDKNDKYIFFLSITYDKNSHLFQFIKNQSYFDYFFYTKAEILRYSCYNKAKNLKKRDKKYLFYPNYHLLS